MNRANIEDTKMEVVTNRRQLFELLQPTETDLYGFKVTLVVGRRDSVLTATKYQRSLYDIFTVTFNKF